MEINEAFPRRNTNPADFVKLTEKNEKNFRPLYKINPTLGFLGGLLEVTGLKKTSPAGNICFRAIASRQSKTRAQAEIKKKETYNSLWLPFCNF